ncbi:MAG TPA: hypothetical protein VLC46_21460 [Thermoanaerobaculia bacterium]|jgi:hypothetical protein|nr:hypothetical protein [Thermoanaerobaculia bacterium]
MSLRSAQSSHEIARLATFVSEGHYFEPVAKVDKNNVVRKRVNRHAADVTIIHAWNRPSDPRKLFD